MTPTTLEPSFLQAVTLVTAFKGEPMRRAQAALLYIGLAGREVLATDIPASITDGDTKLAGCATGALASIGLLVAVSRVKSPNPDAKGRKINVYRLPDDKRSTARAWLRNNGFPEAVSAESQGELFGKEAA